LRERVALRRGRDEAGLLRNSLESGRFFMACTVREARFIV
jgi:hypothetical protein